MIFYKVVFAIDGAGVYHAAAPYPRAAMWAIFENIYCHRRLRFPPILPSNG